MAKRMPFYAGQLTIDQKRANLCDSAIYMRHKISQNMLILLSYTKYRPYTIYKMQSHGQKCLKIFASRLEKVMICIQ